MKVRHLALATALLAPLATVACSAETDDAGESGEAVSTKNLGRADFGLQDHEVALTLDDGPGPRTKELVDYLVAHQVPATFFEVGKNAKADPASSAYVAAHSHLVPGGLIIGNHSMNHSMTPLPRMGVDGATNEILQADAILATNIAASQTQFPEAKSFFRPPFGSFTALGATNIQTINDRGAAKYVGPIFWEIGGELSNGYSADWACWSKGVSIADCQKGYVAEAQFRKRGLILCHDVHSKTIDMLIGGNGRVGLIEELQSKGFKFVSLRSHESQNAQPPAPAPTNIVLRADAQVQADGTVTVTAEGVNAPSIVVYFDNDANGQKFSSPATGTLRGRRFAPGLHSVKVVALGVNGDVLAQSASTFAIAQPITSGDGAASDSACVNYGALAQVKARGQYFDLFHKQIECSAPGAYQPAPGECYKYKGKLTVGQLPQAVGPDEWTVEYDLSYDSAPTDKSKVSMVLEVGTGDIVSGKRHGFSDPRRADVGIDQTTVDCAKGIWHGNFEYADGSTEAFRFSKPGQ